MFVSFPYNVVLTNGKIVKNGKFYLKHNTIGDDVPIVVAMKAMGIQSDQEIVQLVGTEPMVINALAESLAECHTHKVYTQQQALEFIGARIRYVAR